MAPNSKGVTLNQVLNMDNFEGYEENNETQDIFDAETTNFSFVSDDIDLDYEEDENVSYNDDDDDDESHENQAHTYETDVDETNNRRGKEAEGKKGKKPGRKPITSEPTTKRKAQNRAAQRAFRERKEKYLKDLEVKVFNLKVASDTANNENRVLRERLEKMLEELQEYQKRLTFLSESTHLNTQSSNHPTCLVSNNGPKSYNYQIPSESSLDFDLTEFSRPQGQAVLTDEIKKHAVAYQIKPTYYNQSRQQNNLDQSLIAKTPQKSFTQTQSHLGETEIPGLTHHIIPEIPEIGNYDESELDHFLCNRNISKIAPKISNRLSSSTGFMKSNTSHEHEISHNFPFSSTNVQNDLLRSPLILNTYPEIDEKVPNNNLMMIEEENTSVCPRENTFQCCDPLARTYFTNMKR